MKETSLPTGPLATEGSGIHAGVPRAPRALELGLVLAVVVLVAIALPFTTPLVLAAWLAAAMRPRLAALTKHLRGRRRAAAALTLACLLCVSLPLAAVLALLAMDAVELGRRLSGSASGHAALAELVGGSGAGGSTSPEALLAMLERHGARALEVAQTLAGIGAHVAIGLFVLFGAAYVLLVEGPTAWAWVRRHAPIEATDLERLRAAFLETGRGLFVGIGLTALVQALIATIAYVALGIPSALVLGLVTLVCAMVPPFGAAMVWLPVSVGLAVTDRPTAAIVMVAIGTFGISGVDNLLRPILVRRGHLDLHPLVILVAMLGGLSLLGPSGLFLGPLLTRLAVEVVRIATDRGVLRTRDA